MIEISPSTRTLLVLSTLPGGRAGTLRTLGMAAAAGGMNLESCACSHPELSRALALPGAWARAADAAEQQIEQAARIGARILSPADAEYPRLLMVTGDAPALLWVRGALAVNPSASVAIVGTRRPTADGVGITERVTAHCVERGYSMVSGLALGCDAMAHRTALHAGGHTVAVLAHGLHTVYPAAHRALADAILDQGGALVSEFPWGCDPERAQFVQRDRTQAGLARGVVMIQSDLTGGSLHAARAALTVGRWLAVPLPTARDRLAAAPQVRANRVAAEGSLDAQRRLFRCPGDALAQLVVVRSPEELDPLLPVPTSAGIHGPAELSTPDLFASGGC